MRTFKDDTNVKEISLVNYLNSLLDFYKSLGFLQQYIEVSNEILIKQILKFNLDHYGLNLEKLYMKPKMRRLIDILVLSYDTERVWFKDTRIKEALGEKSYTKALQQLSNISQGRFTPEKIIEIINEDENKVYLYYIEEEINRSIEFDYMPGILDIGTLIKDINISSAAEGRKFYALDLNDFALVLMLTESEKKSFEENKLFSFMKERELENFPPAKVGVYLKNFKRVFTPWRVFEFILFLLGVLDFTFLSYKALRRIADFVAGSMAEGGHYMVADGRYWLLTAVIIGILLGGYASRGLLKLILQEKNEGYKIYLEMFCGEGKVGRGMIKVLSFFLTSAVVICISLGLNWYVVFSDSIRINKLLELKEKVFTYSDIASIRRISGQEKNEKKSTAGEYLEIRFQDGTVWRTCSNRGIARQEFNEVIAEYISQKSGKAVE